MNLKLKIVATSILAFCFTEIAFSLGNSTANVVENNLSNSRKIIASNDTFNFTSGCGTLGFGDNVIANDFVPEGISAKIQYVVCTEKQILSFGNGGNFAYLANVGYNGTVTFRYHIYDENDVTNYSEATAYINVISDFDCDGIEDIKDLDDDNDGIPDTVEGNGNIDSDDDGITDNFDIDDDNDGIPDIREWQSEDDYKLPSGIDLNNNGWDDVFEGKDAKSSFITVDTDKDNIPDYLDDDSDNDNINDFIEATDLNFDSLADFYLINADFDNDGLDDAFDIVKFWLRDCNSTGSNVPLPDHNNNGISDFREKYVLIDEKDKNGFTIFDSSILTFPNPTNGLFSFKIQNFSEEQESSIKIFNSNGEIKEDIKPSKSIVNVDLRHLESGIYIVKMLTPELSCTKKLILQNR